jgi:hypothetical protein
MLQKRHVALTKNTDMCLLFDQRESYNNTNLEGNVTDGESVHRRILV